MINLDILKNIQNILNSQDIPTDRNMIFVTDEKFDEVMSLKQYSLYLSEYHNRDFDKEFKVAIVTNDRALIFY